MIGGLSSRWREAMDLAIIFNLACSFQFQLFLYLPLSIHSQYGHHASAKLNDF
jgi:hypothetical protein